MRFHVQGRSYQFKALPFRLSTAPMEFTVVAKEVKLMALEGYENPPVPRQLVGESHILQNLSPGYTDLGSSLSRTRLAGEQRELVPKQVFNFVGYQFDLKEGKVRPTPERWQTLTDKIQSILSGPAVHVPHRSTHSNRKASPPRATPHGAHTVAVEKQLEGPRITRKGDTGPQITPPHLRWWLEESNVLPGQPLHPVKHTLQIFTDASKEG